MLAPAKVDVVVAMHQRSQSDLWPKVQWGLAQNSEHINRVITVNDGGYSSSLSWNTPQVELLPLWHPKSDFGLSRSLNQGLEVASGDFALVIEGDEVLAPGSLKRTLPLAYPGTLVPGVKLYISEDCPLDNPQIIEADHREKRAVERMLTNRAWWLASGGHLLIHLPTHRSLKGFNERYGYGYHDFDYAARWMRMMGDRSIAYAPQRVGAIWHIGSGKGRRSPDEKSGQMFARTLANLYGHRYHLGCGDKFDTTCVNVDFAPCAGRDVALDCSSLDWIPDESAWLIRHGHFLEHLPPKVAAKHLREVYQKLKPGGSFHVECPNVKKLCQLYLTGERRDEVLQGLFSSPDKSHFPGWCHYWGYDPESLSETLEAIGFEIDYSGASLSETCSWRDFLIEASRPEGS